MTQLLRPATPDDAYTIAHLIKQTHGDEVETQHIQAVIAGDNHTTLVAEVDRKVVGFVDNFITIAQDSTRRCELDLLGVDVEFQGHGLGSQLIEASTKAGHDSGATLIRALVAATNTPMHRAMTKTGYQQQPVMCRLYISSEQGQRAKLPDSTHLIPVTTLTYRGVWIEGDISNDAIHAANTIREKHSWDIVGAVIPISDEAAIKLVEAADFNPVNHFQWWHKPL